MLSIKLYFFLLFEGMALPTFCATGPGGSCSYKILLGFTHVIRLALGGQAKSEHGYRIELITYHSY